MRVCAIALIVIFTAVPFSFGAETVPTVTDIKNQSVQYLEGSHNSYELVTTPTYADDERTIYINGTAYYYTPNESSEEKNKQLINLVQTGGKALITTTNLSEAVFTYGSIYYTYDKTKLPQSVYSYGDGSETNYNVAYNDGTTTMYKTINLIPANMKTPTGTGSLEWTKVSDGTGYEWADEDTFPQTSTIKYTDDGAGTLSKAEGVVRFKLPGVGDNVEQFYKFEFIPTGEKHAQIPSLAGDVDGGYFYGLTKDGNGGAIFNSPTNGHSIVADFIKNSANNCGGAIYNGGTISSIMGDFIGNSATNDTGGAIYNGNTISSITGDFIGNSATTLGGAIFNYSTISSITGDFIGNSTGDAAGAIFNNNNGTIGSITGDFIGNSARYDGGAILNAGGISTIIGDFIGNSATNNCGGAIYNAGIITTITGDFIGNSAGGDGGGAIYNNQGTISSITGDFIGNSATNNGGAIYNTGTISLLADTKDIVFENNRVGSKLNDIHNTGTVNLYAKEGNSITFSGTITDAATPTGTTNIGEASSAYTGTVNFNNKVTQNAINLNSGTLHLGVANAIAGVTTFTVNGCTLDTVTDAIETQALGSTFVLNNDLDWSLDVNISGSADTLSAGTVTAGGNNISITSANINWFGTNTSLGTTKIALTTANADLANAITVSGTYTNGNQTYNLSKTITDNIAYLTFNYGNLYTAVHDTGADRTYTLNADEPALSDPLTGYGTMEGTKLSVEGNGHSILGGGKGGVTVGTGQTLNINGGTWKNFNKTGNGAVVSNSGTLAIDTVTLENNTATGGGGAVYNNSSTGIFPFVISNSTFNNNNAQDGGAIYNEGTLLVMNLNFAHNSATRYGGAMFNGGSITTDIMGTFTSNSATSHGGAIFNKDGNTNKIYSIGKSGTTTFESNTSGTGGAIYNGGVITRGIDATFTSNTATNNGGAIYNAGNREIGGVSGTFTSNSAGSKGGAIYNTGRIGASSDTAPAIVATFDSNSAYSGGAIYNNTSGTIYGINSTFTKNRAIGGYGNGGAIDNEGTITYIEGSFGTSGDSTKGNTGAYGGAIYHNSNTAISRIGDENALTTGFYYNNATEGGALFNETNKTITTVNAVFDHNSATSGGAVYNKGTITTLKGEFTNNTATSNGGVLFNSGGVVSNMSGVFTSNTSNAWGGVVYNSGTSDLGELTGTFSSNNATFGGVLFNETSTVDLISGTFTGNRATTGAGGVLYTRGNITEISGTFSNNTASTYGGVLELGDSSNSVTIGKISGTFENNTAASRGGGAIYLSKGTVSDLSGTFRNNSSTSGTGGAINTNTGTTLNITTTSGNTLFSGNTDSTGSNAIDGSGTINMNAGEGKSITFDDKITGTSTININDSSVKSDMTSGTVTFNESVNATAATVSGGTVNLNNTFTSNALNLTDGTVNLGNTNSALNVTNFTASGGTLSTQNGTTSATNLGNVVLNGVLSLAMDANLSGTGSADTFSATSVTGTGSININNIKILADSTSALPITIGTFDNNLKSYVTLTATSVDGVAAGKSYKVSYDNTNGSLKFGYGNLYNAVKDTSTERTYTMGADENVAQDLGVMNGEKLTVGGNNYAVNGNNHAGIIVNNGQTLDVNNVSSYNGFDTALTNAGTLNINNITFENNSVADIKNTNILNLEGTNVFNGAITDNDTKSGTTTVKSGTTTFNNTVTQKGVGVNNGTVNFNNTLTATEVGVNGGTVNFNDTVTSTDLSNAGTVNVKASDLNVTNGVSNSGALNLKEGTLASNISGAGTTNIKGDVVANANITQNTLTVDNTLTINPEKTVTVNNTLNNNSTITNSGGLNLAGGTTSENLINAGTISGSGITTISGVVNNTGKITSSKTGETAGVNVTGTLTTNASNITSENGITNTGTINFVSGETQSNITGTGTTNINGDVTISKTISNNKLVLNSGTTTLTSTGSIAGANSLTANGGGVNVVDNVASTTDLGNLILKEDLKLSIDMKFSDNNSDMIKANVSDESTSGKKVYIQNIHVVDAIAPEIETSIKVVHEDSTDLKALVDLADDINIDSTDVTDNFLLSYNNSTGNVDVVFMNIEKAVSSNVPTRVYNMKNDESVNVDLGAMGGGDNAKLTINGNGHTLSNDSNHSGITVANNQKLNINGLTVSNMTTAITNNNGGEVNITDSTFTGNSVDIHNESALNIKPTDGKFVIFNSVIEDNTTTKTGVLTVDGAGIAIFNDAVTQNEIGVNNGTANFNGVVNTTKTTVSGGKANFNNTTNTDEVNITGGVANFNAQVNTSDMILTDGTTSVNADNLNVSNGINNNATLNITGGTLNSPNTISGTNGTTNFTGNTTNNVTIDQKNVSVSNGITLTNTQTINATGTLTNNGTINSSAAITASTLNNNETGTISSTADITAGGGTNEGSISTTATFTNTGNMTNNSSISATNVVNKTGSNLMTATTGIVTPNDIQNEGTITYTSGSATTNDITGSSSGNVVLATGDNLILNNVVSGNQLTLQSSTIIPTENTDFTQASQFNINGGGMNVLNNELTDTNLGNVVMNNNTNLALDFNLSNMKSDTFTTSSLTTNGNKFNVNNIKISGNTQKDRFSINLGDTTNLGAGNVTSDNIKLPTIMTPIRKIHGNLKDGIISYAPSGNDWKEYNPSVLAAPIAAQLGGYLTQLNTYDEAFQNRDMKLLMTKKEKEAYKFANKYADMRGGLVYTHSYPVEQEPAMWYRGYATFEKVNLNRGPKVSNILYGAFGGGESKMYDIGHGFHVQYSGYLGYTGSHQAFLGNDIYQNGGTLGATAMLYKGNFFTGITANVGASVADVSTRYGSEDFPMILGGAAWKIGYNWELAQSKFIIQPSYMMSYSFVDAFNYTNAAGVRIKDSTLNAINIAPGLKFIGNLKNGWQPYASIQMVWNIMDKTKFTAADIQLPYMSVRPFIQYGVGIQKHHGDRFTGYFQTVLRNGGRNGVALSLGFRWALGKKPQQDYKKTEVKSEKIKSVNNKKSETTKVKKDKVTKVKVEKTQEDKINSKKIKNTQPKVDFQLKQPNVKLDKM